MGVTRTVAQLHAAGYVHRGIKPSNVLKLIQENKWVVSDYACTAPNGTLPTVMSHFIEVVGAGVNELRSGETSINRVAIVCAA